jgi:hypothetical protein
MAPFSPRMDRIAILIAGLTLLVVVVVAWVREASPEWSGVQRDVREAVATQLGQAKAAEVPEGVRQVWIPELRRVDRCVICHTTIEWGPELAKAPNPARSHPQPWLLEVHPVEKFGCTLCHGGQGAATTKGEAHGDTGLWDEPLLDQKRAARYGITPAELMQVNCNACHRREEVTRGMDLLVEAKKFVKTKHCSRCHTIDPDVPGGLTAPNLRREGEKHAEQFVFPAGWKARQTALQWHVEHFRQPDAVVADSEMPVFKMTDRERIGLALLVMSWRDLGLPAAWVPRPPPPPPPAPAKPN